jgi:hypothetical protein
MLEGPFSPFGNISIFLVSEWQSEYIMKCVEFIRQKRISMSPRADITAEMVDRYRSAAKGTLWATGGCRSYYLDEEGVPIMYPFTSGEYRDDIKKDPILADYELETLVDVA